MNPDSHLNEPEPINGSPLRIGLIGDYNPAVTAHQAIPKALALAGKAVGIPVEPHWVATEEIHSSQRVTQFDGLWCIPASPYRNTEGALVAIRWARENGRPFLGTCGGFQHAIVEYARNVLGWTDAGHAENDPATRRPVIALLSCALVEVSAPLHFQERSRLATAYGDLQATEGYHCRYGLNPEIQSALLAGPLRATAHDEAGEVRAVELDGHPFFVATLFQPERAALAGRLPPLVVAFIGAVVKQKFSGAPRCQEPQYEQKATK